MGKHDEHSIALSTAPMFHVTGMQHSLNSIIFVGGTLVIMRRGTLRMLELLIEKYKCTHWANVPTMVVDLLASKKIMKLIYHRYQIFLGVGPQCQSRCATII